MTRPENRFLDLRGGEILQFQTNLNRFGLSAEEVTYLNANEALFQQCIKDIRAKVANPWTANGWSVSPASEVHAHWKKVKGVNSVEFKVASPTQSVATTTEDDFAVEIRALHFADQSSKDMWSHNVIHFASSKRWMKIFYDDDVEVRRIGKRTIQFRERVKDGQN